ncbi:MAG TPA: ABC transporter ATP-binding protein, partial [Bacteroidetes bacterium]|nr:ABC transporter ATP-binding protein [Bacteroidota bacterium]
FLFLTRQTLIVMSRRVEYDLRNAIYSHYQNLTLSYYRKSKTGDLMARITEDVGRVRMYLGPGIMYTINTISLSIIVISTMLMVNPALTLYTILPLPILSLIIYWMESRVLSRSDKIQQQLSKLTAFTQEIYSGIRVAKAYVREDDFANRFSKESTAYKRYSLRLIRLNSFFFPVVMLLIGLSSAITIWVGAEKVIAGSLSIGNIAEFIIYVSMLTWPIIAIGWVTSLIQRAAASQERINQLLLEVPEIKFLESDKTISAAHIVFDNVSFTYPHTGIQAVKNVSFELKPGQKLGILGSTGSGKSTLCNLLPRLLDPDSGSIRIDGVAIEEFGMENLRAAIGYAPQDVFLFSDSIKENIAFGMPGASLEAVTRAAKKSGIHDNIMSFPEKYETRVGERGVTLSGGQKQRIALSRAWIRNPHLLILDDSLSAVDTKTEELILSNLRSARSEHAEMSIIMVSHRISTIQDSDLILVMDGGEVIEQGKHSDLIAANGYYSAIYRKQLLEKEMSVEE